MFEGTTTRESSAAAPGPEVQKPEIKQTGGGLPRWPLAVIGIVLLGLLGFGLGSWTRSDEASQSTASPAVPDSPTPITPTAPSVPNTPEGSALADLVVNQDDVPAAMTVVLIPNGNIVRGATTLDLCNGTFPSETLRTDRLQVAAVDAQSGVPLSTEAVVYVNPAATAQAFGEIKAVAANCPAEPVTSPVDAPTVATRFDPAPDGSWPQTPSVERLAFSFTTTGQTGTSESIAVYLRRGRVLMGLYFPKPDGAQPRVAGKTSVEGIVGVFADRMAELPETVVGG